MSENAFIGRKAEPTEMELATVLGRPIRFGTNYWPDGRRIME